MNRTLAEQFEKFINKFYEDKFETLFIFSLFIASKKRSIKEGHEELVLDAALSLIEMFREQFENYQYPDGVPSYCFNQSYESTAKEISENLPKRILVKRGVEKILCEFRQELFSEPIYRHYLNEIEIEEFPMLTFVRWMDYVDNLKGKKEFKDFVWLKRNLCNLMRVGNAIFQRHEWQNKISIRKEVSL